MALLQIRSVYLTSHATNPQVLTETQILYRAASVEICCLVHWGAVYCGGLDLRRSKFLPGDL
jgi:hypothetical protein